MTWGVEANVRERFGATGIASDAIAFARDTFTFDFAGTPGQFVNEFSTYYGPTMNAVEAAGKNGKADALRAELQALFEAQNKSGRADHTTVNATFLRVTATKPK